MDKPLKKQSNPFSTGGGGINFETRVQAAFTVLMLTGCQAPCLPPWPINKVKLQGRFDGFHTDDFIVFTQNPKNGKEAKLLSQIKHNIGITEKNEVFSEVIQAAWDDFNNSNIFNTETDAFALITGPLSANEINNTRTILEWARHSADELEFFKKVNLPDFSNSIKKTKLEAFRENLKKANKGINISDKQFWEFLKSFHLLGFDLDTEFGSTLSLLYSLISRNGIQKPSLTWTKLLDTVQTANQNAGTITLENISKEVKENFKSYQYTNWVSDVKKLKNHSEYIINGIRSNIGGIHINRNYNFQELLEASEASEFVFLSGERGCGKSSMLREFTEFMKDRAPVFCLRTEDLDKPHLDNVFSSIGLKGSIEEIQEGFALMQKKYLLIESFEKLLELQHATAFADLLQFVRKNSGWTIIVSGRSYAYQQIMFNFLQPSGIFCSTVIVEEFTDVQIQHLSEKLKSLKPLLNNQYIKPLLRNPFFTEIAYRITQTGTEFLISDGEREFQEAVWRDIISKEHVRVDGMPLKRNQTFTEIAVKRAKQMAYGIPGMAFDPNVILKLEEDNLITRNPVNGLISLAHDILEDWALVRYIDNIYQTNNDDIHNFLECLGYEPAMNRAFRLWLHQKIRFGDNVTDFILTILNDKEVGVSWKDEAISAVFLGDNPYRFLQKLKNQLFKDNNELLKRFCFILRISSKTPDQGIINKLSNRNEEQNRAPKILFLKPYGRGWESIILFLYKNKEKISEELLPHVLEVLNDWSSLIDIEKELPVPSREVGLLSLYLLDVVKDSYGNEKERKKLLSIVTKVVPAISNEFNNMLQRDVFTAAEGGHRLSYVKELCEIALTDLESAFLAKHNPETLIKLAFNEWLIKDTERNKNLFFSRHKEVEESFGLEEYGSASNFFPASGLKGPFHYLLRFHPRKGLDFIIELLNLTAEKYANSELDSPERYSSLPIYIDDIGVSKVEIQLEDGGTVEQYCSNRLWLGYRGFSVMPYLLQSALMALENWLISYSEYSNSPNQTLEWVFNYILKNSNSVAPTAVLVSLAVGFPEKFGKLAIPLMKVPEFYDLEMARVVNERGKNEINWHNPVLNRDPYAKMYSKERSESSLKKWRKENLESLVARLQLTDLREDIFAIIDELRVKMLDNELWAFRFHRIDIRGWKSELDEENKRIILSSGQLEPELEKVQQESKEKQESMNRFLSIALWSEKKLKKEKSEQEYYNNWEDALTETKELYEELVNGKVSDLTSLQYGGLVKACVLFIRDYSNEMSEDDIVWCSQIIIPLVLENNDVENTLEDKAGVMGVEVAASVLPIFFDFAEEDEEKQIVKKLIAIAVTHSNKSIRTGIANGIREHLWNRDKNFAQKCLLGSIEYARLLLESFNENRLLPNSNSEGNQELDSRKTQIETLRGEICSQEFNIGVETITFSTHSSWDILNPCLIIPNGSSEISHHSFLDRILTLLFEAEELERNYRYEHRKEIDYELPYNFAKRFADFLLSLSDSAAGPYIQKLLDGCEKAPELVYTILISIEYAAEQLGNMNLYWGFWRDISEKVQDMATLMTNKHAQYYQQEKKIKLIRGMMHADTPWQKIDYENQSIILGKELIIEFVENAGANPHVFEGMASLMYHFPNIFLDMGLYVLSKHQEEVKGIQLLSNINTTFYLENCIQKFLLENNKGPLSRKMHRSCLILLDAMVETASSKAYYLREHLIRSKRIGN